MHAETGHFNFRPDEKLCSCEKKRHAAFLIYYNNNNNTTNHSRCLFIIRFKKLNNDPMRIFVLMNVYSIVDGLCDDVQLNIKKNMLVE